MDTNTSSFQRTHLILLTCPLCGLCALEGDFYSRHIPVPQKKFRLVPGPDRSKKLNNPVLSCSCWKQLPLPSFSSSEWLLFPCRSHSGGQLHERWLRISSSSVFFFCYWIIPLSSAPLTCLSCTIPILWLKVKFTFLVLLESRGVSGTRRIPEKMSTCCGRRTRVTVLFGSNFVFLYVKSQLGQQECLFSVQIIFVFFFSLGNN